MNRSLRRLLATTTSLVVVGSTGMAFLPSVVPTAQAVAPGYNGKIAFVSTRDGNDEIYVMNADGSNQTRITNNPSSDKDPAWSPDGQRFAFRSNRDGNDEIYIMNIDGNEVHRVTNDPAIDGAPDWSPDGQWLTFFSNREGHYDIHKIKTDGSQTTRLTTDSGSDTNSYWSPSGDQIVFASNRVTDTYLYMMNADGSDQTRVTSGSDRETYSSWNPNGQELVYVSKVGPDWDIFTINLETDQIVQITDDAIPDGTPRWSPQGDRLVMILDEAPRQIVTINPDGSGRLQLTSGANDGRYPQWQPIPNVAPVAAADSLSIAFETAGIASVLANDTDEEGLSGSELTITVQPGHGTASVNASLGKIEYTPANGYTGSDLLTYQICDSFELDQKCSTAILGISVTPALAVSKVDGKDVTLGGTYTSTTAKPTFSGTATPGAEIKVEIHSDPIVLTTTADSSGNWSVTPTSPIPPGQHTVIISATMNDQTTILDSFVLGIQAELPQAGASLLAIQAIGSAMVFGGYGLYIFDKRRTLRRRVRPIV